MRGGGNPTRLLLAAALLVVGTLANPEASALPVDYPATPGKVCGLGSQPESIQGYVPPEDFKNGRARQGYTCNAQLVSTVGQSGGFRTERYVDRSGRVCAYFDSTRLFPVDSPAQLAAGGLGVYAVDMGDPAHPEVTARLTTPAMLSPHESLRLNQERGLLVAVNGNPASSPGTVDVYDVSTDCRHPQQNASVNLGIFGHESAFAPDGRTFYATAGGGVDAVDLTNPTSPSLIFHSDEFAMHGSSVSSDGNTLYFAGRGGLNILDVSEIQQRQVNPQIHLISYLTWPEVSIPQHAAPCSRRGHEYLVETDEYGGGNETTPVGAGRIVNIDDPRRPYVVSRLRLQVHNMPEKSFSAHYCTVPSRVDPNIIACGMINSGLRVFDIRDVEHPVEIAYSNLLQFGTYLNRQNSSFDSDSTGSVFSAPAYDPTRNDIWYTDGLRGFYVVHLTPQTGIKEFARTYVLPGS